MRHTPSLLLLVATFVLLLLLAGWTAGAQVRYEGGGAPPPAVSDELEVASEDLDFGDEDLEEPVGTSTKQEKPSTAAASATTTTTTKDTKKEESTPTTTTTTTAGLKRKRRRRRRKAEAAAEDKGMGRVIVDVRKMKSARPKHDIAQVSKRYLSKTPCASDIEFFCLGVPPGNGRIRKCLINRKRQLTQVCMMHLEMTDRKNHPCTQDMKRLCSSTVVDATSISAFHCYVQHREELSPQCAERVRPVVMRFRRRLAGGPCGEDVRKLCIGTLDSKPKALACLKAHQEQLSLDCSQFLASTPQEDILRDSGLESEEERIQRNPDVPRIADRMVFG